MIPMMPAPVKGVVLNLDVLDLPEFQGLLDEHFALLTIPHGIVLPDIRNHEESLHPEVVRSFKTRKPVELTLTAVPEDIMGDETGTERIEYRYYYPAKRYNLGERKVKWRKMRGFVKQEIIVEGRVTQINQSEERVLIEIRPLGIPMYMDLPYEKFRGLGIRTGDFITASFPWFYTGTVSGGGINGPEL
ncbi:hypothetical protein [Thermococcus aciditolerans]|uniref:Uncharacterized protein n=1 Tax=Thermococcus aciditolerans TaxID=2598455 RepID=A0A5C0SHI4_9EURY|nr:hypothetical protein [Thermococcus aciditolerans]QEK14035.1 hypothetical protein FPV09_01645 [Thermococcus aciditolerans]